MEQSVEEAAHGDRVSYCEGPIDASSWADWRVGGVSVDDFELRSIVFNIIIVVDIMDMMGDIIVRTCRRATRSGVEEHKLEIEFRSRLKLKVL